MRRFNSNGHPFLIERPEGGFTYFRNVPPRLQSVLSGELAREIWTLVGGGLSA